MEVAADFERRVLQTVKAAEERGEQPLVWAMEAGRCVQESGMGIPSVELGEVLVNNLCFANNSPSFWKLLDQAMASRIISPTHVLSLLTSRVIPHRRMQPEAYRLYLELLGRYTFQLSSIGSFPFHEKIVKSIDDALKLSYTYGIHVMDIGQMVVFFLFSIILNLIDSILEDYGLHFEPTEKKCAPSVDAGHGMDIDGNGSSNDKRNERREMLHRMNALMASEIVEKITANAKAKILLRLVHLNMPEKFNCLLQRLQFIKVQISTSQNLIPASSFSKLSANIWSVIDGEFQMNQHQLVGTLINIDSSGLSNYPISGAGQSACWITFDIFMEKAMDGRHLHATSAVDILTELTKTLQLINQASWQETFKALWVSALRLVQRDREPLEGPMPHIDARLCILLAITPLAIAAIIKEEDQMLSTVNSDTSRNTGAKFKNYMDEGMAATRRHGLISSLQQLGQFTGLLSPPPSVVSAANTAASKAAAFVSDFKKGNDSFSDIGHPDTSVKAIGSMLHLIVEACITRNLIDTSAYFWPGYVVKSSVLSTDSVSVKESPWLAFMEGSQLSSSLKNSLMTTPASSVAQLEKLYNIALNGSEEERSSAAKILCGASLSRGWNIQEHAVHFVVKLLSPPAPPDSSGTSSHLFGYLSMLNSILFGACCIDVVHIISLYGLVPEVAAALMPLCEAFGSLQPKSSSKSSTSDGSSVYSVFSCAFLFLLRLWKFYSPPHELTIAERWAHTEITLDYLLLMYNSRVSSQNLMDLGGTSQVSGSPNTKRGQPIYIDSFPKLQAWYFQNQACVASTLSGVCSANPVHQVANKILNLICRKMSKVGLVSVNPSSTSSSSLSGSPVNTGEDAQKPFLPAWEILEAIPFVLEAVLTACANGRLSSRDLTTGLRDLVDFLPASLATIISYFSSEITRGIWKPVQMNGIDWPSPAPNILSVDSEITEILASAGVHVPSCYGGGSVPMMLPLPMAALVGLTITFKLDKSLEYIHGVAGPALENCAASCPWPSMPIIGALWEQKVRRWHDFIIFSCARSPFRQNRDAISQLLRSCFSSFLGPSVTSGFHITGGRGVNALLGYAFQERGARLPIAPGFLYLRSCRGFFDTRMVCLEIVKLVSASARELASGWACSGVARLKSSQVSLASAAAGAKQIATLGASLLCIAGGVRLVQVLYMETMPTWLLSRSDRKESSASPASCILEGYVLAYLSILSGALVWGVSDIIRPTSDLTSACRSRRDRAIAIHMDFIAGALEGNIFLGCDPATWKAYVSCYLGLLVRFLPAWISLVKPETLKKLANGLRGWHESELALSLLERGGPAAMASVVELIL